MALQLSPADAQRYTTQLDSACNDATGILRQVQQSQENMVTTGWQGQSATGYTHTTSQQNDDFGKIITELQNVTDIAKGHIQSIASSDNG